MEIFDEAIFCFEDEPGVEYKAAFIQHQDAFWLVATWMQLHVGGSLLPDRIVPMAQFEPQLLGQVTPMYRLARPIPRLLFDQRASPEQVQTWMAQTFPSIAHIPARGDIH